MSTTPRTPYTHQKLSRVADLRIRGRLLSMYLRRAFGVSLSHLLAAGLIAAVVVLAVVPQGIERYQINAFIAQAEAAQLEISERTKQDIYEHTYVVREGKDKAAYVAKQKNIPLEDARAVPLRSDTITEWKHGITQLNHIETNIRGKPLHVSLNLENNDHMHVFEYAPDTCAAQESTGIHTESCTKKTEVTETYRAHRSVFDGVHDIASLYEGTLAYNPQPGKTVDFAELTYAGEQLVGDVGYTVFVSARDNIEIRYFFDTETHLLKQRTISILDGDMRYEMSEIQEVDFAFLPAEEAPEIFNPNRYSYEQMEVIPLSPQS